MISKINNCRGRVLKIAVGITMLLLLLAGVVGAKDSYEFVLKIPATQQWYFNSPSGIVVDNSGNVYVADTGNNRIQKFGTLKGDINDDGNITIADASLYLRYASGQNISPYHMSTDDDVTCDGAIHVDDA